MRFIPKSFSSPPLQVSNPLPPPQAIVAVAAGSTWPEKRISIVTHGWSDSQRRPLINFMAVSESGPMFLKAVDCSGEIKNKFFIFDLLKEVVEDVGPQNVVQIITDNAKNCQTAGLLVEGLYPHIVWTPCVVHTLNLALQNICAAKNTENNQETFELCCWISGVSADATMIKNFIMNHGMRLAIFNKFVPLKLLSIAITRFASVIVMLKRFKLIKRCLLEMVITEEWDAYREDDVERAASIKMKILGDTWWDKIEYILSFTAPLYDMLRACDTDKPCLHLVYDMWFSMIEKPDDSSRFYNVVHTILESRWKKNSTSLHCLAHSLNPRYYSKRWLDLCPSRVAPHRDLEVAEERSKCFKKYFPIMAERRIVTQEFANFSSMSGHFADSDSIEERYDMDPKSWWVIYGTSTPKLQALALKILNQPSSLSCAERNWSTYSFIHSLRRNKMTPKRAEDLVFIHSNLRFLSRKIPKYYKGDSKMWDIGGDNFGTLDDVGDLEIAQLSLDEPELESIFFTEDGNEDTMDTEVDEGDFMT
ncbi:hypothetical protein C2S52_011733 [Perilla frutescens var. hirtella]|nr:hypothetical protein C2S52_011733 [Perilla frutescens var. hirtella]